MTFTENSLFDAVHHIGGDIKTLPSSLPIGVWRYCSPYGKSRHNKSIHLKRLSASVVFGMNMITSERFVWSGNQSGLSVGERQRLYAQAKREQLEALFIQEADYAQKAKQASVIWGKAYAPNPAHAYLLKKHLNPVGLRQLGSRLVVPIYGINGHLQSLQFIDGHGGKRFMTGAKLKGGFSCAQPYDGQSPIILTEGWATSQSLTQQWAVTGWHVCSFSADNLILVAQQLRSRFPHAKMLIGADNDVSGKGQACARLAAQRVNADVLLPSFTDDERKCCPRCSDWNDRYLLNIKEVSHA